MYTEDDFLQLSALQHFIFCKRQCALIHIEQQWIENVLTAEGRLMHEKVHEDHSENISGIRVVCGMLIHSFELGLNGKADTVEFHKLKDRNGWIPFPVEYKHGRPKNNDSDKIQLCAQAICLEEMIKLDICEGALFYGKTRHRLNVRFDDRLRDKTKEITAELHIFIEADKTPAPVYSLKCKSCSFFESCLPKVISKKSSVLEYLLKETARL